MISKKFFQNNLLGYNNKFLKRNITNNLINYCSKGFSIKLNPNFSHTPNALPLDTLKIDKKLNNNHNNTLNDLLLNKLSKIL